MSQEEQNKQEYEVSFLVSQEKNAQDVVSVLSDHGGEITHKSPVRHIELAYPIAKREEAWFGYVYVSLSADKVNAIVNDLNHEEEVFRFLVVTPPVQMYLEQQGTSQGSRPQPEKDVRPREEKRSAPSSKKLTNEDLQEKLEEILQ